MRLHVHLPIPELHMPPHGLEQLVPSFSHLSSAWSPQAQVDLGQKVPQRPDDLDDLGSQRCIFASARRTRKVLMQ